MASAEQTPSLTEIDESALLHRPSVADVPAYFEDRPSFPTPDEYMAEGEQAYNRARMLKARYGRTPDTIAEFQRAGRAFVNAGAEEIIQREEGADIPEDPIRQIVIAECLGEQAAALDIAPYIGSAYQPGGKFEGIIMPDKEMDSGAKKVSQHEYLKWLSGEYLVRASTALMGEDSVSAILAGEMTPEKPVELMAEAAEEAADDVHMTPAHASVPHVSESMNKEALDAAREKIKELIRENAKQPEGAEFVVRMSEITLEELSDSHEFSLV